jgi:hypothetical protein
MPTVLQGQVSGVWTPPAGSPQARALACVAARSKGNQVSPTLHVTLNFHPDRLHRGKPILQVLAAEGVFRSQFETGTSNGRLTAYPGGDRWRWENRIFGDTRVGSGGYGYTSQLPGAPYDGNYVKPHNIWGCSNAQIFFEVSPQMHWEFALKYDLRWLTRWGLTYYGYCEPLDRKIDILRQIPNLRKISVSPWCNTDRVIAKIGGDYVMSRKPSPAILAEDQWHPERARQDICDFLDRAQGCHVELIMKDISTVRYQPRRLWEWAEIAIEVAENHQLA